MVTTPERPSRSAKIQTPKVMTNCRMTEVEALPTLRISKEDTHADSQPATTLPTKTRAKTGKAPEATKVPAATAPKASL